MSDLVAIAYVSTANYLFTDKQLETLLADARARNREANVSGTLLYNDGSFFQYLEGARTDVESIYERIKRSRQHHGMIELLSEPVDRRHFESWEMGFAHSPRSVLLQLAQASWLKTADEKSHADQGSPGLALLLRFWSDARR